MAIKITMTNKWLYSLIAVGVFLALSVGVLAPEVPSISFGHSAEDVLIRISGSWIPVQYAYDQGFFSDLNFSTATSGIANLVIKEIAPSSGPGGDNTHPSMCVLLNSGEVKCTGNNNYGQLGVGDTFQRTNFELVVDLTGVDKLTNIGRLNYCAILQDQKKGQSL